MLVEECTICEEIFGKGGTIDGWDQGLERSPPPSFFASDSSALVAIPALGLGPVAG